MIAAVVDRFDELLADLTQVYDVRRVNRIAAKHIERPAQEFFEALLRNAPEWEEVGERYGRRPSVRQWDKTLRQSFVRPFIVEGAIISGGPLARNRAGAVAQMNLDHPSVGGETDIVDWLTYGTRPHLVPNSPEGTEVRFWWGDPLKWSPPPGYGAGWYGGPDTQWGKSTGERGYWALPQNDFVADAERETADMFYDAYQDSVDEVLTGPLIRSDLLDERS